MKRKIAFVPALSAYYAMPASYDPADVTREDATYDSAICGAAHELDEGRAVSKADSNMARATATTADEEALSGLDAIDEEWGNAITHILAGDIDATRKSLEAARDHARVWGSSMHEDKALALLPDDWTNAAGTYREDGSFVPC
jgi:hypothetical protein